jgi:hypothetical protein
VAKPDARIRGYALIDGFVIDCLLSDNHTFESEITEFPVESGSFISDNIRNKPLVVAMECIVSNTPLEEVEQFRADGSVPADDAYAMLRAIRKDRRLVQIATSLDHYNNMGLESLTIPRATGRGDELRFNATFKQVQIIENKRETRVAIPAAQGPTLSTDPVEVSDAGHILVHITRRAWFDNTINGWRNNVSYQTPRHIPGVGSAAPITQPFSRWVLTKDRPLELSKKEWDNRTVAEDLDPPIRKLLRSRRKPGFDSMTDIFPGEGPQMRILNPGEYIIEALGKISHG